MEATWYGHSNFRLTHEDTTILIDPFFVGNPSAPISYKDLEKADLILVTHDHTDHVGQAIELAVRLDAEVIAIADVISSLIPQGLPEALGVGMNMGGRIERYGVTVQMVYAAHSSVHGASVGFILTFKDGRCLYYAGDTGLFGDMALFPKFNAIDTAFLPIGDRYTMGPKEAAYACSLLKCGQVVPMHWGTWPILEKGLETFAQELTTQAPETKMITVEPGKPAKI